MSGIKEHVVEPIITNPKIGAIVGGTMMALPVDVQIIKALNVYVTFFGGILGLILTILIIYKNIKDIRKN
jgi:hypothetical protein